MALLRSETFWGFFWGITGLIVGIATYYLSKPRKVLTYTRKYVSLIDERASKFLERNITIDGTVINRLILTTITFVNDGNQTIESSDFSDNSPLRIKTTGHFLSFETSRKVFSAPSTACVQLNAVNDKEIHINFDYIRPKESFSIKILHNGNEIISSRFLSVLGDSKFGTVTKKRENAFLSTDFIFTMLGCIFEVTALIFALLNFLPSNSHNEMLWSTVAFFLFEGQISFFLALKIDDIITFISLHNPFKKRKKKLRPKKKSRRKKH